MKSFKNSLRLIQGLMLFIGLGLSAQDQKSIIIKDAESNLPIDGIIYQYGSQSGVTGTEVLIKLVPNPTVVLKMSHISYGEWSLSHQELIMAIEKGEFSRKLVVLNLPPVTVISVNHGKSINTGLQLNYQDNMSHDAGQVLRSNPLIGSIKKSGAYGFDPVIRGFKYDQINVVLDGAIGAIAACPNRMDPPTSQMAPNMIERIEILKGPYALRFGNGFGGTVNFISNKSLFQQKNNVYGRVSSGYETNGSVFRSEGMLGINTKRLNLELFGSWSQGNDYRSGEDTDIAADFSRISTGMKGTFKISSKQNIKFSAVRNFARDTDFPALAMDLIHDDTWLLNASHEVNFESSLLSKWETSVFGSFVDHTMSNELKDLNPRMVDAITEANTALFGLRTEGTLDLNNGTLYIGADTRRETADGYRDRSILMGPMAGNTLTDNVWQDGQITKTSLFSEYSKDGDLLNFVFSGRLEINQSQSKNTDTDFGTLYPITEETQINPALSIGMIRPFNNQQSLSLWLGRTQRSGGLTERFINFLPVGQDPYEIVGNPNLDPEINNQVDLIFASTTESRSININIFASLMQHYFMSVINPNLTPALPSSPGVRQVQNMGKAFKSGFEVSWYQKLNLVLSHQLSIAYTYAEDMDSNEPLPEIAPLDARYMLKAELLKSKLIPSITFRAVAKQNRISSDFGETETPGFSTLDFKAAYAFNPRININIGVDNILDEGYYEHLNRSVRGLGAPIFERGRNFYFSLNLNF